MDDETDWTLVSFDRPSGGKETGVEKSAPVAAKTCPKCGKTLGRGGHFHIAACKGGK